MDEREVRAWKERWALVDKVRIDAQRRQSIDQRWHQLNALVRLARSHGMVARDSGEEIVWRRWARLKGVAF